MDLVALSAVLRDAAYELRQDVQDWTPKGPMFERFVAAYIGSLKEAKIWKRSQKLDALDGSTREIDLGVHLGEVLFVIDCVSLSRSVAFDQGKPDALAFRAEKLLHKLESVDSLAAWLKAHPSGRNYRLPSRVRILIPAVISPFVEYIWSRDEQLWLTDEVPRVATVEEISRLLSSPGTLKTATTRGHVVSLSH